MKNGSFHQTDIVRFLPALLYATIAFLFIACAENTDSDLVSEETVEQTLANLGVETSETPRVDDSGNPLPQDYSPLGSARTFDQFNELALLGFPLEAGSGYDSNLTFMEMKRIGTSATYDDDVLSAPDPDSTPWAVSNGPEPSAIRQAVQADIDKDGLEELIVVYRAPDEGSLALLVYEDEPTGLITGQSLIVSTLSVHHIALASGDLDGDGYDEIIIALSSDAIAQILFIENTLGALSLSATEISLSQSFSGSDVRISLDTGNIDFDPSLETVVVVNEYFENPNPNGTSRYMVFDDKNHDFDQLTRRSVHSDVNNGTAIVADVSLGDIDGDNLDEIVLAGLTHFDPNGTCDYTYFLLALDDWHGSTDNIPAELGTRVESFNFNDNCADSALQLRFVHINTGDFDGDGYEEIQANQFLYDDFLQQPEWTPFFYTAGDFTGVALLPVDRLFADNDGFTGLFSQDTSTVITGDFSQDKRMDIAFYSQHSNEVEIWGISDPDAGNSIVAGTWKKLSTIGVTQQAAAEVIRPILVSVNLNHDSLAIAFDAGEYQLAFTEPVIIAALAAAPCFTDLGQNTDACRTSYGTAESTTVALDQSLTISAGITVGFEHEFSDPITAIRISQVSAKLKTTASLSLSHSASYTYTERVVYTTGPVEDSVIFTSIPYDRYTYTVTSHPDESLIGEKVIVSMPRAPVTLQVARDFYNANVMHGGPLIDESVFQHTAGRPMTYPNEQQKDAMISGYSSIFPTQWAYDIGPQTVGQGSGDTNLEINIATDTGFGVGIGIETEFEAEMSAGPVVAGFSIGVSHESSLQIVHGSESLYSGSVANLPSESFAANYYSWGLFTYVQDDHPSGRPFEVINYWVE